MKDLATIVKKRQSELAQAMSDLCQKIINNGTGKQAVGNGIAIVLEEFDDDGTLEFYSYKIENSDDLNAFSIVGKGGKYKFVTEYGGIEVCDIAILLDILSA